MTVGPSSATSPHALNGSEYFGFRRSASSASDEKNAPPTGALVDKRHAAAWLIGAFAVGLILGTLVKR